MKLIELAGDSGRGCFATVDDADFDRIASYRWYALRPKGSLTMYARRSDAGQTVYMHREVIAAASGDEIDHIDGNGLNNCRNNLRKVTHAVNLQAARIRIRAEHVRRTFDSWEHLL